MKTIKKTSIAIALLLCVPGAAYALPQYTFTDLGAFGAQSLSSTGSVAGSISVGSIYSHAALYSNGSVLDLGVLAVGGSSGATGVNAAGVVVGSSDAAGGTRAFLYDGTMHNLGTLGGNFSTALGITDSGTVVGYSTTATGDNHAFLYDGTMHDLGAFTALGISASGNYITGYASGGAGVAGATQPILYDSSLHTLGWNGAKYAMGNGVNDSGVVVATAAPGGLSPSAYLYNGSWHNLGNLGGTYTMANGINNAGWIVGNSEASNPATPWISAEHAFLSDGTTMFDLNNLLVGSLGSIYLTDAKGINNSNQIVALGSNGHSYLLSISSVPVPAAAWFFGSGLCGLAAARRKFKAA